MAFKYSLEREHDEVQKSVLEIASDLENVRGELCRKRTELEGCESILGNIDLALRSIRCCSDKVECIVSLDADNGLTQIAGLENLAKTLESANKELVAKISDKIESALEAQQLTFWQKVGVVVRDIWMKIKLFFSTLWKWIKSKFSTHKLTWEQAKQEAVIAMTFKEIGKVMEAIFSSRKVQESLLRAGGEIREISVHMSESEIAKIRRMITGLPRSTGVGVENFSVKMPATDGQVFLSIANCIPLVEAGGIVKRISRVQGDIYTILTFWEKQIKEFVKDPEKLESTIRMNISSEEDDSRIHSDLADIVPSINKMFWPVASAELVDNGSDLPDIVIEFDSKSADKTPAELGWTFPEMSRYMKEYQSLSLELGRELNSMEHYISQVEKISSEIEKAISGVANPPDWLSGILHGVRMRAKVSLTHSQILAKLWQVLENQAIYCRRYCNGVQDLLSQVFFTK